MELIFNARQLSRCPELPAGHGNYACWQKSTAASSEQRRNSRLQDGKTLEGLQTRPDPVYEPMSVNHIQKLRRERYLTQEELAVRLNVSDRHLRSLESGEYIPSIDLFIEIAAFFDVTLDHLIMGKSLSDQEESLRNKLQQKRLTNQKLRLKLQRIMQKLSAIAEEL